jgi:hypothetical protein
MAAGDAFAYRGYLVKRLLLGEYLISKDGVGIHVCGHPDEAKHAIDLLEN